MQEIFDETTDCVIKLMKDVNETFRVRKQEAAEEPKVEPAVKKTVTKAITLNNGKWNVRKGAGMQYQSIGVISSPNAKTGKPVCIGYETVVNGWFKTVYGYISQKAVKSHI